MKISGARCSSWTRCADGGGGRRAEGGVWLLIAVLIVGSGLACGDGHSWPRFDPLIRWTTSLIAPLIRWTI